MKILFTLDYELFLGCHTGAVQHCLVDPLDAILAQTDRYEVRFTIFVDATFLHKLNSLRRRFPKLDREYAMIVKHIQRLSNMGHDIQLHVHPNWFYSTYDGDQWHLAQSYYKLSDLSIVDRETIFMTAKQLLDDIVGYPTIVFRAGGFSSQPTSMLAALFDKTGIVADSSVCPGLAYESSQQTYNYTSCPDRDMWRFSTDICVPEEDGKYIEFPITMSRVSPLFYYKLIANRFAGKQIHRPFGDGIAVQTAKDDVWRRLTRETPFMATIDGYKIVELKRIYEQKLTQKHEYFTVLGHPKLATPYSVNILREFCEFMHNSGNKFFTIRECVEDLRYEER